MSEGPQHAYGTPSFEEDRRVWKRFPGEPDVTDDEYALAANSLDRHLSKKYTLFAYKVDGDLYVRGDCFGDRTQYVEICVPEVISSALTEYLQAWLRDYERGAWRILIPTNVGDDATILIYPSVVRLGARWCANLPEAYEKIAQMMRNEDRHGI